MVMQSSGGILDAATAELSRAQVWQWIHHPTGVLEDGRPVTVDLCRRWIGEELERIRRGEAGRVAGSGRYVEAARTLVGPR